MFETLVRIIAVGAGATVLMDLCGLVLRRLFRAPAPDYRLVGRWIGHMPKGRFAHAPIAAATQVPGEGVIGWVAHYLIGAAFAAGLVALTGPHWLDEPTFAPALAFGAATIAFPMLVMQPAFGLGFAASKTPRPAVARLRSLVNHLAFGLGLYLAALAIAL